MRRSHQRRSRETLLRDLVVAAAAISAGVHAALVPEHLREGAAAGGGFIAASVLLVLLVVGLTELAASGTLLLGTALVFAGLLLSYALAVTAGLPVLQPEPERVDALAAATKSVEALGLVAALDLIGRGSGRHLPFLARRTEGA